MITSSASVKSAGYLLCLIPQLLLLFSVVIEFPWLCPLFFFVVLPVVRGENTGFGKNRALSHFTRYCGTPTAEIVHRRSSDSDARRNLRSD